ncbi:MAG: ABC transporter ATP-binding protein [Anaerovoracaceae bacterium]|jgi:ABC-2 type transport system ATP-binding protein
MDNVIEVSHLTKKFKEKTAVDDLSFTVRQGEILGLLGPNGSGKSTTINCILALLTFQRGDIRVFGKEMMPSSYDLKARIGVIFQDVAVFDELSVQDNIDYFCGLYVTNRKVRQRCVEDALRFTGLEEYRKIFPKKLSGGLLRRLNIACGIAHRPQLLFADEPTAAVDPQSRSRILDGFRRLRDSGVTIIYTTHYMEEVEQICDRVIILDAGKILASGTIGELKQQVRPDEDIAGLTLNDVFLELTGKELRD